MPFKEAIESCLSMKVPNGDEDTKFAEFIKDINNNATLPAPSTETVKGFPSVEEIENGPTGKKDHATLCFETCQKLNKAKECACDMLRKRVEKWMNEVKQCPTEVRAKPGKNPCGGASASRTRRSRRKTSKRRTARSACSSGRCSKYRR